MKLLLTNGNGIDAAGLEALRGVAARLGEPIIVAPREHLSGCSHRVTTSGPLRLRAAGDGRYAADGTPADCVRLALHHLAVDAAWVLAGVNASAWRARRRTTTAITTSVAAPPAPTWRCASAAVSPSPASPCSEW